MQEAEILKNLNQENIIRFENVFETSDYLCIVMEMAYGGNLKELIQEKV